MSRIYKDRVDAGKHRFGGIRGEVQQDYCKREFGRIKNAVQMSKIGFSSHALQRIFERVGSVSKAMNDMRKNIKNIMYNTEHECFYITGKMHIYVISKDTTLKTVKPRKRTLAIYPAFQYN